jgi:hypothetical protein
MWYYDTASWEFLSPVAFAHRKARLAPLRSSSGAAFFGAKLSGMLTVRARKMLHVLLHKSQHIVDLTD